MSAILSPVTDPFERSVAQLRTPPHSIEAESAILGGLLLDPESQQQVPGLVPEHFYRYEHRLVFEAIQALAVAGQGVDVVTVFVRLESVGKAQEAGGLAYLNALAQYRPSATNMRRYAEIVRDQALLRSLVSATDEIAASAFNPQGKTSAQILDAAQMQLAKLATVKSRREPQHIHQSLAAYLQLLNDLSEGKNPAIPTGIGGLDRLMNGGLRRGEMMVIGARPKHGKTALSLAMARNMAHRFHVLFISQEMPVNQLMHRHTAAMGSVDLGRILRADATDSGMWERVSEAAERLGRLNLVHDDQSAQSLMDVRRKAVKVKREHGLDVLFVDFLQLMQGAGEDSRNRELDVISNGLKGLAMDLDIGLVLMSQMSRKADEHYGRPAMTHLRDSGAIEAAADQVALLFTDHAHPMSPKLPQFTGYSEIEIVAHRNGPQGLVPLQFAGQYQQIGDWDGAMPQKPAAKSTRGMSND
jgi:replicative DNA helicase